MVTGGGVRPRPRATERKGRAAWAGAAGDAAPRERGAWAPKARAAAAGPSAGGRAGADDRGLGTSPEAGECVGRGEAWASAVGKTLGAQGLAPCRDHPVRRPSGLGSPAGSVACVPSSQGRLGPRMRCLPSSPDRAGFRFPLRARAKGGDANSLSLKSQEIYNPQPGRSSLPDAHNLRPWRRGARLAASFAAWRGRPPCHG